MKSFLLTLLIPAMCMTASAQTYQVKAALSTKAGKNMVGYIIASTKESIRFKAKPNDNEFTDAKIADFDTIYLIEPDEYATALDLYEAGKFSEAKEKFAEFKESSKAVATLKDNFHTLSAFHEMEALRRMGDYEGLATALQSFNKEPITREHQLRQLDLYVMWDAVKSESWDRLIAIASERKDEKLPGYQRVQVAFCKGLALQKSGQLEEAILEYSIAMTADAGASNELVQNAAINTLQIYSEDAEVQQAITNWGTEAERKNSTGFSKLKEAAALAKFYEGFFIGGKPLPENYQKLVQYAEKIEIKEPEKEAKPEAAEETEKK